MSPSARYERCVQTVPSDDVPIHPPTVHSPQLQRGAPRRAIHPRASHPATGVSGPSYTGTITLPSHSKPLKLLTPSAPGARYPTPSVESRKDRSTLGARGSGRIGGGGLGR